jgi:hypothetical protein
MTTIDPYAGQGGDMNSPSTNAVAVTPSDTVPFATACRRLWVGGTGAITFLTLSGASVTYTGVPSGSYLMVRATQVMATGTTATNIVAEL